MNIKHSIFTLAALLMLSLSSRADEGMWLPMLISERIADMQAKGFRLSAEDIYSVNQASLKDAVVLFGSGCTGEMVSRDGLLFTNHHCGYSQIQKHSSTEHDYLRDGFWAMTRDKELPNPGLSVKFLEYMQDVTDRVQEAADEQKEITEIVREAIAEGDGLKASVEKLYYGNRCYLFVYREYSDVRLVGAPPSSIGKFGGETDNWMWPRHTGDFSIFRVYCAPDGKPAAYSPGNVPYHPKKYFKISRGGVQPDDFTFIYGFPGSTQEYVVGSAVHYISEISDPAKIDLRTRRLDIMNKYMTQSQDIRIRYSSKKSTVANAWKKWQGEVLGLRKNRVTDRKKAEEKEFRVWATGGPYDGLVDKLDSLYALLEPYNFAREYTTESVLALELPKFATEYVNASEDRRPAVSATFYKDWYEPIDRESFITLVEAYGSMVPKEYRPSYYDESLAAYGSIEAWADAVFSNDLCSEDLSDVAGSEAYRFRKSFATYYNENILPRYRELNAEITALYSEYMRALMEFTPKRPFYPDANLTLRVAYGKVGGYEPSDGVEYRHVSTLKGIMQKDNPDIFDYNVPQSLRDLYATGLYDDQPVCFIATNHTTGGNSGSPVISADGHLLGLNFDRVWEGTMSDLAFDPEICRNICLDIRWLLFVVDKVCGAGSLLDELDFVD